MKVLKVFLGIILGIIILVIPISQFQTSPLDSLQTLTVQLDGRKKPLDTLARETVAKIHGKSQYTTNDGEKLNYLDTYLSLWLNNRDWNQEKFILFNYRPLKEKIGLNLEQKYFSFAEIINSDLSKIIRQVEVKQNNNIDLNRDEKEALTIEDRIVLMMENVGQNSLPIIPHPTDIKGKWLGIDQVQQYYEIEQINPILTEYNNLQKTYQTSPKNLEVLGNIASSLHQQLYNLSPQIYPQNSVMKKEVNFYKFHLFAKTWQLYILAFLIILGTVIFKPLKSDDESTESKGFYEIGLGTFMVGIFIQGYAFIDRMEIANRPPVTNMYESVIWVGFGIALFALIFELIYRAKYYLLAALPLSIICLILADNLPAVLDPSIKPLVPVLRDNFWLSVHVPTITLSYASFALAMGLGHIILGFYLFKPQALNQINKLFQWNYRVLQLGVLLLTTGIILGGIWAHFSWGRFWGWDPKETWALIALMAYIVPLHGRLAGWLSQFGMSVISIVSFNAVLMAWYGVNFVLGKGLHSYGFATGGSELIVGSFVILDLIFVIIATLRYKNWSNSQLANNSSETTIKTVEYSMKV